jgi:hypothetical protein
MCHFFWLTLPNFLKRLALKASFQQISFAKKFEAKKLRFFSKISTIFNSNFTGDAHRLRTTVKLAHVLPKPPSQNHPKVHLFKIIVY